MGSVVKGSRESGGSCAEQESYLIVHVWSRAVSMYMFCPAWSIVPSCGGRRGESHLGLLDSIVRLAKRLCEGEYRCLVLTKKISAFSLLYKIYHRVDHLMNEYLKHFVAVRYTRASAILAELDLVVPRCRTDQFSLSFLSTSVCV